MSHTNTTANNKYTSARNRFAEWMLKQIVEIIWDYLIILFEKIILNIYVAGIEALCCTLWPWIHHPASRLKVVWSF